VDMHICSLVLSDYAVEHVMYDSVIPLGCYDRRTCLAGVVLDNGTGRILEAARLQESSEHVFCDRKVRIVVVLHLRLLVHTTPFDISGAEHPLNSPSGPLKDVDKPMKPCRPFSR
jgi:hypothetical protein